ncbi:uncharacterized protein LOC127732148 [Mytilus californianus]|uniref:uncharacterized protein LOC127732148 n=1 Tax=Mytilus californianus TaxID=6549 RepID=UPI00224644CA|nr:uncharacterized protein LOC127732148 [Mytilus californianus]
MQGTKNNEKKENAKDKIENLHKKVGPQHAQEKKTAIRKNKKTVSSKPKVPVVEQCKKEKTKPMAAEQQLNEKPTTEHTVLDRKQYFSLKLHELQRCKDYESLQAFCTHLNEEFKQIKILINEDINIVSNNLVVDKDASNLFPKKRLQQTKFVNYLPVVVYGDGNCLPRSISTLIFGNEDHYMEVRTRITVEMCINAELYLKNETLLQGNSFPNKDASCLLNTYIMFLEQYTPGDRLTRNVIRRLYEEEVMNSCKNGSWMGIWELLAVSSVLNCELLSVYPDVQTDVVPQTVLHRRILPLKEQHGICSASAAVMWSSTRHDGFINHFVPLLPLHRREPESLSPELLMSFEDSDTSFNEDDSFIKTFLENEIFMNINKSDIDVMSEVLCDQADIADGKYDVNPGVTEVISDEINVEIHYDPEQSEMQSVAELSEVPYYEEHSVLEFEVVNTGVMEQSQVRSHVMEQSEVKSGAIEQSDIKSHELEQSAIKSNIMQQSEVKSVGMEQSEVKSYGMEQSEVQSGVIERSEVKTDGMEQSEVKSNGIEQSEVKSDGMEQSEVKSNGIEQSEVQSNGMEQSEVKSNGIEQSEVQSNGMEQSEVKSYGKEQSEVKSNGIEQSEVQSKEGMEQSEVKSNGIEQSEVKSDGMGQSEVNSDVIEKSEVQSGGMEQSEVKSDGMRQLEVKSDGIGQSEVKSDVTEGSEVKSYCMEQPPFESSVTEKSRCLNGHGLFTIEVTTEDGRRAH